SMSAFGTNSSISMTRLLSSATASSSSGSTSMYSPLLTSYPLDDVVRFDLAPGLGVDLLVLDPIAGLLVQLVEADLFAFRGGWKQRDRTRDKRQLEVTFPVRTRGHENTPFQGWNSDSTRSLA